MRTTSKTTTLLALMAAVIGVGAPSASALGTGGVASAPSSPATTLPVVRAAALATWFGPGFYGHKTACGQTLTPAVVGVANRTLPCGTLVKVSFAGDSLIVPVIDRGPYGHKGANWDLTAAAAQALGIEETVRVSARVVGSAPNTPTLGLPPAAAGSVPSTTAAATLAGGAAAG